MKVLVVGRFYAEGFALHIAQTLAASGHDVRRYEAGATSRRLPGALGHRINQLRGLAHATTAGFAPARRWQVRELFRLADQGVELTLVCHDFLWPAEVAELRRRTRGPVVMWFPDALSNFGRGFFMNAPYDAIFFKDPYVIAQLAGVLEGPVYYLPECFNPTVHQVSGESADDDAFRCDVTTAGNPHTYRIAILRHLEEWDVKLWGAPLPVWLEPGPVARMVQGRSVFGSDKARAFRAAKIVLNNLNYAEVEGVNVRTFEAAGVGAFQLVDWRPALSELFTDGKELVTFRGVEDLKAKIRTWLPRDEERRAIGDAARERALREHTYAHRLALLLETVAGRASGFPLPKA